MSPDKIYLHAGTLTGYKSLLNEKCKDEYIEKQGFDRIVGLNAFEPKYIEDILCIYKKNFKAMKM